MKKIKESGTVAIKGGNFNSDGPLSRRRTNKYFSAYNGGGHHDLADDNYGGIMGIGKNFPVDYFEDANEDEEDVIQEGIFDGITSALFSVPIVGDLAAAASFLWKYFGPYGLRAQLTKMTKSIEDITDVELGDDFLEPENITFDPEEFDERFRYAIEKLENIDSYPDLKKELSPQKITEILDRYDELLDSLQTCFISFFGAADYFAGQAGVFTNLIISTMEPIDFVSWIGEKYLPTYIKQMKKLFPDENSIMTKMAKFISKPLDSLGHFDLLINEKKLNRIVMLNKALVIFRDIQDKRLSELGEEEGKITKVVNFLLDKLFENEMKQKKYKLSVLMESYLETDEEESFEEINLEDEIDEAITIGSGNIAGRIAPLGDENRGSIYSKKNKKSIAESIHEQQIERMRLLEAYHQRTSNRLK